MVKQEFYRSLFEHNPDGIYSCDAEGNFLEANPAFEKMMGYTVEEIQRITLTSLVFHEHRGKRLEKLRLTLQGQPQEYELTMVHKNGHHVYTKVKSFPILVEGKVAGVYKIIKDISEAKQLKADLQVIKQQLDIFLVNTIDSVVIFDLDQKVIKVNGAFEKVFGWSEQELVGKKALFIPENLMDECIGIAQKVTNDKHVVSFETVRQRKDGSYLDVSSLVVPLFNEEGKVKAYVSVIRDISERKRVERELHESEKRLRTLIDAMPDFVLFKDEAGRWLEANLYALSCLGLTDSSYKGKTDKDLANENIVCQNFSSYCKETDEQAWSSRKMIRDEETLDLPHGKTSIFDVIKVPIFHPEGERKGLVIIGRDITDLKHTEKLLRKSEKLAVVGQLSAGIAHEIKNPLTSLKGFLSLLRDDIQEKNEWYLNVMSSEINRIESIANQFMAAAQPQVVAYEKQCLLTLIHQVFTIVSPDATMNNVQLIAHNEEQLPLVECEVSQMKQVFINIVKNAIEAMPSGGILNVYIRQTKDQQLLIRFMDQGEGIPQERIPYLGEPFYSLKEKGTGLGLMMCYKIIEEHQGEIQITSKVNEGTTVDIILPVSSVSEPVM